MAARRGPVLLTHSDLASFHLQAAAAASASCTSGKAAAESKAQQAKQEAAAIEAKLASLQGQVETLAALQTDLDKASRRVGEWAPKRSLDRWIDGGREGVYAWVRSQLMGLNQGPVRRQLLAGLRAAEGRMPNGPLAQPAMWLPEPFPATLPAPDAWRLLARPGVLCRHGRTSLLSGLRTRASGCPTGSR